ncbi:DNA repair protein RecO [Candidatus Margulisiibacteriota bacterium]
MRQRHISVEGFVLRVYRYKETSKLLRVFTKEQGKMMLTAKGARRTRSKLGGMLDLFKLNRFQLYVGNGFPIVQEAELIRSFYSISQDSEKFMRVSEFIQFFDKSTADQNPDENQFHLLYQYLNFAESHSLNEIDNARFIQQFHAVEGVRTYS